MGLLVTGSNNGSVKVWNFETGELVNTLSHGASSIIEDSDYEQTRFSDHTENIVQLVVTRYCDVDTGPGLCRGCDTCFGNGFFISSSDTDGTVHVWRLERSGGDIDHNCNLCTKDYHRQKYGRSSRTATGSVGAGDDNSSIKSNGRRRHQRKHSYSSTSSTTSSTTNISSSTTRRIRRYKPNVRPPPSSATMDDWVNGLLDIEQLAGNDDIDLDCVFLGKIHHVESRSLVFCDNMILAGVRKKQQQQHEQQQRSSSIKKNSSTECEAWFASLQYFEPQKNIEDHDIPIEVFDLESASTLHQSILNDTSNLKTDQSGSLWKCFSWLFGSKFTSSPKIKINGKDIDNNNKLLLVEEDEDMDDDNDDDYDSLEDSNGDDYVKDPMNVDNEALEMLPFSSIEHAVSLEGLGFACDYGNFIKVICLDNVKSDALRHQQYLSTSMNGQIYDSYSLCSWPNDKINSGDNINSHGNNNNDTNQSIKSTNSQCQCKSNGKECCGGKPKNGEKCCGGKSASSRSTTYSLSTSNITSTAAIANNSNSNNTAIACNPRSITECMSKSNCSRAGDCPLATSNTKSRWF
ncbi:hypothetical protein BJ944DRAFT_262478 [Cunninghamella echinulata]|nr:hypothetical protein BJ944DRAFT_262478 [Cunninghamella echinulata]